ncbi:MAG: PilZ domain-containing protein [Bdellovibrionota bacterium]
MLQLNSAMRIIHVPPPIFIRSNFTFNALNRDFSYLNHGVSRYGISALHWEYFDPTDHVGENTSVTVDVLSSDRFSFTTPAQFTAEITQEAVYLGMRFKLNEAENTRLTEAILREGYCPTNYLRKYPRIPAWSTVPSMPLRTIVDTSDGLIVFDIANISPNGILLYTENPKASFFYPTKQIIGQIEPRGDSFDSFDFEGVVCRVMLEKNPETNNTIRYLGIRFLNIPGHNQEKFLEILRSILDKIQKGHYIAPAKKR